MLNTPQIPNHAFAGNSSLSEGTGIDGVGDLAGILQNVRKDLTKSDIGLSATGIFSGPLQCASFEIAGGATANKDIAIPSTAKIRIIDAHVINRGLGTASDTVQLKKKNGVTVNNISNAMDINIADQAMARVSSINDAYWELDGSLSDELRVTLTDGGGSDVPAVLVVVQYLLV
jgi:hypothetical protein